MKKQVMMAALSCMVMQACTRDSEAAKHRAPTADGPPPHADVANAAPLNNVEGSPEQARDVRRTKNGLTPDAASEP